MQQPNANEVIDVRGQQLTVEEAIANLRHPDVSLRYYAAWWLGKFRVKDGAAVNALIEALSDEDDRTELGGYPLRRNAARALAKLGDRTATPALITCLDCSDYYVREAAAQALGTLKATEAIPVLMNLIQGGVEANLQVPGLPHLAQPCDAVIEALGTLQAQQAIELIEQFRSHPAQRVQYAANRALYQLTQTPAYAEYLVRALFESDVQLRRVALADLGSTGYLPAADAIVKAPIENGFKLIALKGLLESQAQNEALQQPSPAAIKIMDLMDSLL